MTSGPVSVAQPLLETLQREHDALEALDLRTSAQLEALREAVPDLFSKATLAATDAAGDLGRLRPLRERQLRLLGRCLGLEPEAATLEAAATALRQHPGGEQMSDALLALRQQLRARAEMARARCGELEFALQCSVRLGREVLAAWRSLDAPAAPVYTAKGRTAQTHSPRSFLNRVG